MRLPHVVCASLLTAPIIAAAQTATELPPRRFGLTAGINSATIKGDTPEPDARRRTAFIGGLLLVVPLDQHLAIQPELLYTMKGVRSEDANGSAVLKMHYFQVPLLLRFTVPAEGGVKPFLYAGPAVSFKTSCRAEGTSQGFTVNFDCKQLEDEDGALEFKSTDYGLIVGGGLAFAVSGKTLTIGARYDHSFAAITNETNAARHRVISGLATLEFPLMKK